MSTPLRVLHLEDDVQDAELVAAVLADGGVHCQLTRVQTRDEFTRALADPGLQVVLADYSLPDFDGLSALRLTLQLRPELPFLFVSGALGEEVAIEGMKIGATDYIVKARLWRLVSAIPRALRELEVRKEKRLAEERLREAEAALRARQEMLDLAQQAARVVAFEWQLEADPRPQWLAGVHAEDRPALEQAIALLARTGELACEYRAIDADGALHWMQARGRAQPAEAGQPARVIGFLLDVTDRHEAEVERARLYRDLAAREARIRRLVDSNMAGIFMWDFHGRILDANDAFLDIVGYQRSDLEGAGLRWTELTPPEWQAQDQRNAALLKEAGTLRPYEKEYFRKDGSRVPVLVGGATFDDASNEGVGFVLDLTERKRAEAEARASERRYHDMQMRLADANRLATIGHLSAAVAHELNQPLAGIVANASTCQHRLQAAPPNVEGAAEVASRLIRDAHRAAEVIQRLRALFANRKASTEWVDVNEAAREVVAISSAALRHDQVTLRCDFAQGLPLVSGDRVQLQQVIMNLLSNATDAMRAVEGRSRQLAIQTAREEGDRVRVTVRDTGPGLDAQHLDRLFEAFYTTKSGGMGIGLSVSRSIIERHQGRLWAEANDGPGASFSFSIPRTPAATLP